MDILDLIRTQIKALPPGEYLAGLNSVLRHVEAAYKHFARGQADADESAFTDVIYRTNQAFEGRVKEAYRVLAQKDPSRIRPYDIEQYLEDKKIFKNRILAQFTNYRTEWRNPATHDHNLIFDEAEAFLAIVSVSAFTKLLVDEIAERSSYVAVQKDVTAKEASPASNAAQATTSLGEQVATSLSNFPKYYSEKHSALPIESESQLIGALSAFLSSILPTSQVSSGRVFKGEEKTHYIDLLISNNNEQVVVEIKRGRTMSLLELGLNQLQSYLAVSKSTNGALFLYDPKRAEYDFIPVSVPESKATIWVVSPVDAFT